MIKLRDKRTKNEIHGTVEEGASCGYTEDGSLNILNAQDEKARFNWEWGHMAPPDDTETATDEFGDRLFYDKEWNRIPERFIEPFAEGMSDRQLSRVRVVLEMVCDSSDTSQVNDKVCGLIPVLLSQVKIPMRHAGFVMCSAGSKDAVVINATEAAMMLDAAKIDPACINLTKEGQDILPEDEPPQDIKSMSMWDDRPGHPVKSWQYEVENGDTRQGYADWAASREEEAEAEGQIICHECGGFYSPESECDSSHCMMVRGEDKCKDCGSFYEPAGDGYNGRCPDCADKAEEEGRADE